MNDKRVLLLIPNMGKGGAQRVFYDHAIAFNKFCCVEEAVFDRNHDRRIYDSGLPLHDLKAKSVLMRLGSVGRLIARSLALRRLVQLRRFDLVISHMDGANWVNVLSFSSAKKILVVHGSVLHDQGQSKIRKWFRTNIIPAVIYNRAELTVAVSDGIKKELVVDCGLKRVITVKNYFDVERIIAESQAPLTLLESGIFKNVATLITSGRLAEQKRHWMLLEIVAVLKRRGISVRLIVLGDGEWRNFLLEKARALELKTYQVWNHSQSVEDSFDVYFMGYVSNPFKYVTRANLFLFPSAWEGFPLSLCEAMIVGTAVISADCPTGPREILSPDAPDSTYKLMREEVGPYGVLMPMGESPENIELWANTVQKLLGDAKLRREMAISGSVSMKKLDAAVVIPQWREILESTCNTA